MPDFGAMIPFASLFADSFNIKEQPFTSGFPGALAQTEWFGIRYEGNFVIPRDGGWLFKLDSRDGAVVYIDGAKVLDNDGRHETRHVEATRGLKGGVHKLRLDYFHTTGPVALILTLTGGANAPEAPLVGQR